jgi:hypothetical protein
MFDIREIHPVAGYAQVPGDVAAEEITLVHGARSWRLPEAREM